MNSDPQFNLPSSLVDPGETSPIVVLPYMWIGDFVRGHSLVTVLRQRWPNRPVDMVATTLCTPMVDYMPGVRSAITCDLPRRRLALARQYNLGSRLRAGRYGTAIVISRSWKAALAPALAGVPERVGFFGEFRFGLINDSRLGERSLTRLVDKIAILGLPKGAAAPSEWPVPKLDVPLGEIRRWRQTHGVGNRPAVALAPGSTGASKRWPFYADAAKALADHGFEVWVIGGPDEKGMAADICRAGGPAVRDLTGNDLRNGIVATAAANVVVANDSGLLHIAAAVGTPTIGIFGSTSPYLWAPLNGLAATMLAKDRPPCQPCQRSECTMNNHQCMRNISASQLVSTIERVIGEAKAKAGAAQ